MTPRGVDEPWERQGGESARAFAGFRAYRDLGSRRSLRAVAKIDGRALSGIERLSAQWDWVERARAWDQEQDRIACQAQLVAVADMRKRHVAVSHAVQAKAVDKLNTIVGSKHLSTSQMLRAIDLGVRIEREALGMSHPPVVKPAEPEIGRISRLILRDEKALNQALDLLDTVAEIELHDRKQERERTCKRKEM